MNNIFYEMGRQGLESSHARYLNYILVLTITDFLREQTYRGYKYIGRLAHNSSCESKAALDAWKSVRECEARELSA